MSAFFADLYEGGFAGAYDQALAKWNSIPDHVRMIVAFLCIRMFSAYIKRKLSKGGGGKGAKGDTKGAVKEVTVPLRPTQNPKTLVLSP
jgi:hypothetical protein